MKTVIALLFCLNLQGCVRVYVASPDVFSFREPPGVKTAQVLTDLRTIGTALEVHMVDHNSYPAVTDKDLIAGPLEFAHVERLEPALKNYARHLSPEDPWGSPYLYWTSGDNYMVVSTGSDRVIRDQTALATIANMMEKHQVFIRHKYNECLQDEIIFSGGQFLQSPNHASKECPAR
jgi:hypothetical protein